MTADHTEPDETPARPREPRRRRRVGVPRPMLLFAPLLGALVIALVAGRLLDDGMARQAGPQALPESTVSADGR